MTEEGLTKRRKQQAVWYAANREKVRVYQAAYRAANPEKAKARKAEWSAANPEKLKAQRTAYCASNSEKIQAGVRMTRYGMSPEAFQLMLLQQKNACGICKEIFSNTPHVDHDHKTGEVRGLLCARCNRLLGCAKDSLEILESAKEYLRG